MRYPDHQGARSPSHGVISGCHAVARERPKAAEGWVSTPLSVWETEMSEAPTVSSCARYAARTEGLLRKTTWRRMS